MEKLRLKSSNKGRHSLLIIESFKELLNITNKLWLLNNQEETSMEQSSRSEKDINQLIRMHKYFPIG